VIFGVAFSELHFRSCIFGVCVFSELHFRSCIFGVAFSELRPAAGQAAGHETALESGLRRQNLSQRLA
jgi:hypothetical protein